MRFDVRGWQFRLPEGDKQQALVSAVLAVALIASAYMIPVLASDDDAVKKSAADLPLTDRDLEIALKNHFATRFFNTIDADAAQQEKISKILDEQMSVTRPLREELRESTLDLVKLVRDSKVSDDRITERANQLQELRTKIANQRLKTVLAIRKELTDEQLKAVGDRFVNRMSGCRPRRILEGMLRSENPLGQT